MSPLCMREASWLPATRQAGTVERASLSRRGIGSRCRTCTRQEHADCCLDRQHPPLLLDTASQCPRVSARSQRHTAW
eukprot:COSAG02_NODE_7073_length_3197_cov_7.857327_2_plen_77_part_00